MLLTSLDDLLEVPRPSLPIVIPTFNNESYLRMMVNQLPNNNLVIVDNNSSSESMRSYLEELSSDFIVVCKEINDGPQDYHTKPFFWLWLPNHFFITDPDIGLNLDMPKNYAEIMRDLSLEQNSFKVGVALDIFDLDSENYLGLVADAQGNTIFDYENRYWKTRIQTSVTDQPVWRAATDTTFSFVNKDNYRNEPHDYQFGVRIAGSFIAQHYGWYKNPPISIAEQQLYLETANMASSTNNSVKNILG